MHNYPIKIGNCIVCTFIYQIYQQAPLDLVSAVQPSARISNKKENFADTMMVQKDSSRHLSESVGSARIVYFQEITRI